MQPSTHRDCPAPGAERDGDARQASRKRGRRKQYVTGKQQQRQRGGGGAKRPRGGASAAAAGAGDNLDHRGNTRADEHRHLAAGEQGVLVTCAVSHESRCFREVTQAFEALLADASNHRDDDAVATASLSLEDELAALRRSARVRDDAAPGASAAVPVRFVRRGVGARGAVLVALCPRSSSSSAATAGLHYRDDDPATTTTTSGSSLDDAARGVPAAAELVARLFTRVHRTQKQLVQHGERFTPVEATCYASPADAAAAAKPILARWLHPSASTSTTTTTTTTTAATAASSRSRSSSSANVVSYAIQFRARNNTDARRLDYIHAIAACVRDQPSAANNDDDDDKDDDKAGDAPCGRVDLNDPDVTLHVHVIGNVCYLGAVPRTLTAMSSSLSSASLNIHSCIA